MFDARELADLQEAANATFPHIMQIASVTNVSDGKGGITKQKSYTDSVDIACRFQFDIADENNTPNEEDVLITGLLFTVVDPVLVPGDVVKISQTEFTNINNTEWVIQSQDVVGPSYARYVIHGSV